jgi:hypothetical protein
MGKTVVLYYFKLYGLGLWSLTPLSTIFQLYPVLVVEEAGVPWASNWTINFITCGCESSAPFICNLQSRAGTFWVLNYKIKCISLSDMLRSSSLYSHFLQRHHILSTKLLNQVYIIIWYATLELAVCIDLIV